MSELDPHQNVALDIVDFVYFYDILSLNRFSVDGEDKKFFQHLNKLIDKILVKRKKLGVEATIYKHFLLCIVEITASHNFRLKENINEQRDLNESLIVANYKLCDAVQKNGINLELYLKDGDYLFDQLNIYEVPNSLSFQLVATALAFDFEGCISIQVYRKFLVLGLLKSGKNNNRGSCKIDDNLFLRALLLVEFEIMRNKLYHEFDMPEIRFSYNPNNISKIRRKREEEFITKNYIFIRDAVGSEISSISKVPLGDANEIKKYLLDINAHFPYVRIFSQSNTKWSTLFGLWYYHCKDNKGWEYGVSLDGNIGRYTEESKEILEKEFGFIVSDKSIRNINKKYMDFINFFLKFFFDLRMQEKKLFTGPPLPLVMNDYSPLNERMNELFEHFQETLD